LVLSTALLQQQQQRQQQQAQALPPQTPTSTPLFIASSHCGSVD
jgi:hypothetical protein